MKLKLDSKIIPNTPTSCFIHSQGLNNRNRAKVISVANNAIESEVYCEKVSMPSNVYEVGIIYGNFSNLILIPDIYIKCPKAKITKSSKFFL